MFHHQSNSNFTQTNYWQGTSTHYCIPQRINPFQTYHSRIHIQEHKINQWKHKKCIRLKRESWLVNAAHKITQATQSSIPDKINGKKVISLVLGVKKNDLTDTSVIGLTEILSGLRWRIPSLFLLKVWFSQLIAEDERLMKAVLKEFVWWKSETAKII